MSDIVDLTDSLEPVVRRSPYGDAPCREPHKMCVIGRQDSGLYFVRFLPSAPAYKAQRWSVIRGDAKRFDDRRIAAEYAKFAQTLADCPVPSELTMLFWVEEDNPLPVPAPKLEVIEPAPMSPPSIVKYLTTYSGKGF